MGKTLIRGGQLKPLSKAEALALFADTLYNLGLLESTASVTELNQLVGVTGSIQSQLNAKLDASNLKNDNGVDWTDNTTAATALAIAKKIEEKIAQAQIGGAMVFKGSWSGKPAPSITGPIKAGYTYTYDSGTAPTGVAVEAGDMLIAAIEITTAAQLADAASWVVVQTNIDGAVTAIETLTNNKLLIGKGGKAAGVTKLSGLLKVSSGTPSAATRADVVGLIGNAMSIGDSGGTSQFAVGIGEILSLAASGGGNITFDATTKKVTFNFPPSVSIANGTAVANQYVSGMSISAAGAITITRANLPPDVTQIAKTTTAITGTKNGTNKVFTLPENAVAGSVMLFLNGQCLVQGSDYTLSGAGNKTITFATDANIPVATDVLSAYYIKL